MLRVIRRTSRKRRHGALHVRCRKPALEIFHYTWLVFDRMRRTLLALGRALAAILVLGGIAAAMHYCHRECQVTKRQEILAAQNQQMMQQPGSAATYQVDGQVPMMSQHHHQHSLMMPQQQQQQTVMMAIPPELAHAQVVTGEVLPGQPFAQQQQPPPPPVAQGP